MQKPKLGLGESDFRTFREKEYYYVDKSLFIEEFWEFSAKVQLIPRPRRFGKTLNLSMLRYFFEDPPPSPGSKITQGPSRELFRGLAIEQTPCIELQGRFPVIYLTFKDIKEQDFDTCLEKIRQLIAEEFSRHEYLLEAGALRGHEKELFRGVLDGQATKAVLGNSLRDLAKYIHRATGTKPILLMDEYDTPVIAGYIGGYYDEAVNLMRGLIGGPLKDCEDVEKAAVTGVLRVAKEALFSGLNNIWVASLLRENFADKFGFTEPETEQALREFGMDARLAAVREWYNGYLIGQTVMYNPWSILSYILSGKEQPEPYWVNTSSVDLVRNLFAKGSPELHSELELIIKGESVEKAVNDHTALRDIENDSNALWSLLLHGGYLKSTGKRTDENGVAWYTLVAPNQEVVLFYREAVTVWLKESFGDQRLERMLHSLTKGDIRAFGKELGELVADVLSVHDVSGKRPERVYHAFVLGMLVQLGKRYTVDSNRESGYGRYDVMLIPRDTAHLGLVLEFKKFDKEDDPDMPAALKNALGQIEEKNYAARLREAGVSRILGVGIVFKGKEVAVESREL